MALDLLGEWDMDNMAKRIEQLTLIMLPKQWIHLITIIHKTMELVKKYMYANMREFQEVFYVCMK